MSTTDSTTAANPVVEAAFQKWWNAPSATTGHPPSAFMDIFSARAAWFANAPQVSPIPNDQGAIRKLFYQGLAYLRKNKVADFREDTIAAKGVFSRFMYSETENAWIGFRIAMQAARRMTLTALQPMDTAPLDGTEVLLRVKQRAGIPHKYLVGHFMGGGHCIDDHPPIARGWYFWNGCAFDLASEPEGWMALPADEARA